MRQYATQPAGRPPATRNNSARQTIINSASVPAPVSGWNARDSLADMASTDAITLINWFPMTSDVRIRPPFQQHVTGITGNVESLMEYASPTTHMLIAAANLSFYNVTSAGAVGAAQEAGHTNNRWQHVMFGTSGGSFLMAVNGVDTPRNFDGATWNVTPAITGVGLTPEDLIHVNSFKRRLFFVEKNSLSFWYLAVESIGGTASEFDLGPLCSMGGSLMAMATWSVDGGSGQDDLAAFITTEGECLIYQGTDPSMSTAWSLVGVFRIGRPIGRRCYFKVGSDVVIVTEDGFFPLSKILRMGRTDNSVALSDKIRGAVNEASNSYRSLFGWQPILYPAGQMGIFNVPTSATTADQYVMNTITGAWAQFTNMNAFCWSQLSEAIYFGGNGKVYQFDAGSSDNGLDTETDMKTAFSYFGSRGRQKRWTMARPVFFSEAGLTPAIGVNVDFEDGDPSGTTSYSSVGGTLWDTGLWDVSAWSGAPQVFKGWLSIAGIGYCAAFRMQTATRGLTTRLNSIDYMYEVGGQL